VKEVDQSPNAIERRTVSWAEVLFVIAVMIGAVAGGFALSHDFSRCDPRDPMCESPVTD
jgi:hypothetical protein